MNEPEDFLHNDEIERILYTHMSRGRWLTLAEIYALVEQHAELTAADRLPAAAGSNDPRWRRNVRNFLQSRKNRGDLEWDGDARYRLSETADHASLEVGRVYRRQELHDRFGGQRYGGISTPTEYPIVMLISGEEGAAFGYDDEQLEDGTLIYFGEGQTGPMEFTRGNLAVRDHAENGEELHVFRKTREGHVRYVGSTCMRATRSVRASAMALATSETQSPSGLCHLNSSRLTNTPATMKSRVSQPTTLRLCGQPRSTGRPRVHLWRKRVGRCGVGAGRSGDMSSFARMASARAVARPLRFFDRMASRTSSLTTHGACQTAAPTIPDG